MTRRELFGMVLACFVAPKALPVVKVTMPGTMTADEVLKTMPSFPPAWVRIFEMEIHKPGEFEFRTQVNGVKYTGFAKNHRVVSLGWANAKKDTNEWYGVHRTEG